MPVKEQFEVLEGMFPTMWIRATWLNMENNCTWARACMQFLSIWVCWWWDDRCSPEGSPPWPGLGHQSVPGQSIVWCSGNKSKDRWGGPSIPSSQNCCHRPATLGQVLSTNKGNPASTTTAYGVTSGVPTSSQFLWPACNGQCGPP